MGGRLAFGGRPIGSTEDRMGTILHLNPPPRTATAATDDRVSRQCEIVIFPGVRIERHTGALPAAGPKATAAGGTDDGSRPRKSS
jgi:hypothetical protein